MHVFIYGNLKILSNEDCSFSNNYLCNSKGKALSIKDYYKILGVRTSASAQDIKKTYRKLAIKYHPDKNPDNLLSETRFKEISEAYSVLFPPDKRRHYDNERLRSGITGYYQYPENVTPAWLLKICKELNDNLIKMDQNSISYMALQAYILLILADEHIEILQEADNKQFTVQIIKEIIEATSKLDYSYLNDINNKLYTLAGTSAVLKKMISINTSKRYKENLIEKTKPLLIVFITLLLCLFVYIYSRIK